MPLTAFSFSLKICNFIKLSLILLSKDRTIYGVIDVGTIHTTVSYVHHLLVLRNYPKGKRNPMTGERFVMFLCVI
uniref:Ovule protein n=1 Tax=Panagrolaimus sp. JU765 TaxID=591449 RepID=A0AC34RLK5_9BILA